MEIRSTKGKEMVKFGFIAAPLGTPPAFHPSARGCATGATPGVETQAFPSLKGLHHRSLLCAGIWPCGFPTTTCALRIRAPLVPAAVAHYEPTISLFCSLRYLLFK